MKKQIIITLVLVLVVVGGGFYYLKKKSPSKTEYPSSNMMPDESAPDLYGSLAPSPSGTPSSPAPSVTPVNQQSVVKEFKVAGTGEMKFTLSQMAVKKGDKVRIVFNVTGGMHDWVIDEFNAKTNRLTTGQAQTIEFTADKVGTFEYYCSVGSHRAMGMKGNLVVTP